MKTSSVSRGILTGITVVIISTASIFAQGPDVPGADNNPTDNHLADADNSFAFDLLKQIEQEQPGKNIFISPFSASTALQMVANGAVGQTKTEMQNVLHTAGIAQASLDSDCEALNGSLASETNVILDLANSIWYQNNFRLKRPFISDNRKYFNAELAAVDFHEPSSAQIINDWASKKTFGKIQDVVSYPFPPATEVILANAIYFKGKWEDPFDKSHTLPHDFHLPGGNAEQVPMMGKHKRFSYEEGDDYQAVKLPYAGRRLEMILFLPATNSSPQQLLKQFSGDAWRNKFLSGFSSEEGDLMFPKFKLNYDVALNDSLMALGMQRAFSPNGADFSAMANQPLFISAVRQKSYVAVDEEGTEAAAVTTVHMVGAVMMMPLKAFQMIVDRPFFFVITDNQTQAILFIGIVNNPAE